MCVNHFLWIVQLRQRETLSDLSLAQQQQFFFIRMNVFFNSMTYAYKTIRLYPAGNCKHVNQRRPWGLSCETYVVVFVFRGFFKMHIFTLNRWFYITQSSLYCNDIYSVIRVKDKDTQVQTNKEALKRCKGLLFFSVLNCRI